MQMKPCFTLPRASTCAQSGNLSVAQQIKVVRDERENLSGIGSDHKKRKARPVGIMFKPKQSQDPIMAKPLGLRGF